MRRSELEQRARPNDAEANDAQFMGEVKLMWQVAAGTRGARREKRGAPLAIAWEPNGSPQERWVPVVGQKPQREPLFQPNAD